MNHGQVCFSCERVIIQRKIAEKFLELLKQKATEFPQAQGVNTRIVENAYNLLLDAELKGAKFILGRPEYLNETALAPVLVTDVTKDMKMYDEESFGPSATVIIVEDDEEAIKVANETSYGLDAFVHTKDMKRALYMARELEVGKLRVNGTTHEGRLPSIFLHQMRRQLMLIATFPFTAVKGSGWGANNADAGMDQFLIKKGVIIDI
jgi:acyl-CoA reductase-like NAD-dependent aldehyde dehydrogenase